MSKRFLTFAFLPLITAAIPLYAQAFRRAPMGTLVNGVYHNNSTGIEFTVPSDWVVVNQGLSAGRDAQVIKLRNTVSNEMATVWVKQRNAAPADFEALMSERLDVKAAQRNNFEGYKYRPDSVRHTSIGGRPALSAVADYVIAGRKMVEYLTWVDGEKSRVVFVGRIPPPELADFQMRFDPLIRSAVVP